MLGGVGVCAASVGAVRPWNSGPQGIWIGAAAALVVVDVR
jgi:hypothetical protein